MEEIKNQFNVESHGKVYPFASRVCLLGILMHFLVPEVLINQMGFDISGRGGGAFYQKIHPGTYVILMSFFILLSSTGNPFKQIIIVAREYKIYSSFILLYVLLFFYWAFREASGVGVIIETHLPVPICAIVLSYAPQIYCRRAVFFIIIFAVFNGLMGIVEAIGRFRFFPPSKEWIEYIGNEFRASAMLGHPLNSAMFTPVVLFVAMAVRMSSAKKIIVILILLSSLLAFGGRAGLVFTLLALALLGIIWLRRVFLEKRLSMRSTFVVLGSVLIAPIVLVGGFLTLLNLGVGGRIVALSSLDDSSAQARLIALRVFDFISWEELILGVSANRVDEITYQMGLSLPFSDIENPWLLMCLFLGVGWFTLWLIMTGIFVARLMWKKPLALQFAVIAYFVIASTSNSFGRKDPIYAFMVATVICAARTLDQDRLGNRPQKIVY